MANMALDRLPQRHRWRSSKPFILSVVILALFCDTFLYSFPVPILNYMIADPLQTDPSKTQNITTALLSLHGFIALIYAPIIAHFAYKTPKRKLPLLISLAGCLVGTLLLRLTPSIPALFAGRILQGIVGSATWIVGSATLTDHMEVQNLGKLYGLSMSFVSAGVVAGPAITGTVLVLAGYWPAWSVPFGLLAIDIIMRSIMIGDPIHHTAVSNGGASALLADDQPSNFGSIVETYHETHRNCSFYQIMLSDARVVVGLFNTILSSSLLASFDATLTLHLRDAFGWGSLAAGMMFLSLQIPFIFLGSLAGWLRDRVGLRYPTAVGWALLAPVMWLMGVPGTDIFPSGSILNGEGMFIFAVIAFGVVVPFVCGTGYLQLSIVMNEFQVKDDEVFGQYGGSNRVFALQDMALSLGLMIGPLISGSLSEAVGHYWMSFALATVTLVLSLEDSRCL
ncbi:hypothetical protein N7467_003459 [Penicillium canescens]|nr:hypothetical protein N7467_003459 [Penicillium canescens]